MMNDFDNGVVHRVKTKPKQSVEDNCYNFNNQCRMWCNINM